MVDYQDIIKRLREEAEQARIDAGYSGRWDDGGAAMIEMQIEFYLAGKNGTIPDGWKEIEQDLRNEAEPEYAKYLELKQKFGG